MGGHAAWRKRVANGELAKGSGGAALRHRPRFGRKGKDIELNRKGNIKGGNPERKKRKADGNATRPRSQQIFIADTEHASQTVRNGIVKTLLLCLSALLVFLWYRRPQNATHTEQT